MVRAKSVDVDYKGGRPPARTECRRSATPAASVRNPRPGSRGDSPQAAARLGPIKVLFDRVGNTLNVWFDDPQKEHISEETSVKDKHGRLIGFEVLNYLTVGPVGMAAVVLAPGEVAVEEADVDGRHRASSGRHHTPPRPRPRGGRTVIKSSTLRLAAQAIPRRSIG